MHLWRGGKLLHEFSPFHCKSMQKSIWVWRPELWCASPHHGKVGEEGSSRAKPCKDRHGWEGAGWKASSWAGSRCFSSGGFKEQLGRGEKREENFHAILQQLVLPGLWSQGERAEPLELAWEQVGEGAAVICSRRSLATTLSRWKAGYRCAEPPPAAPQPPQPLPAQGEVRQHSKFYQRASLQKKGRGKEIALTRASLKCKEMWADFIKQVW